MEAEPPPQFSEVQLYVEFSDHAAARMEERGVDEGEVEEVLRHPDRSYRVGRDVVYVRDFPDGRTVKVRVRNPSANSAFVIDVVRLPPPRRAEPEEEDEEYA